MKFLIEKFRKIDFSNFSYDEEELGYLSNSIFNCIKENDSCTRYMKIQVAVHEPIGILKDKNYKLNIKIEGHELAINWYPNWIKDIDSAEKNSIIRLFLEKCTQWNYQIRWWKYSQWDCPCQIRVRIVR